ncbi:rhodanese-like domain-containing protein [Aquimarina aggregata]|uniref:rhodanese-like domain-containing protein n=1 Tax=Aquimarina aggregata TaxID=1642818 RepID=UPI0024910E5D|nr:rhodanese-like domain-containing protein [Aquimarina aggregata]
MKKNFYIYTVLMSLLYLGVNAQTTDLDKLLSKYNNESVPYISVNELKDIKDQVVLLDAREKNEFDVSHIKNAKFVGYDHFKINTITKQNIPKDTKIVVYCSLGVRSEDISEKLKKAGYTNVLNLYGGIFEWKNKDYDVVDSEEKSTEKVHVCSKEWSKWLLKGKKVY